MRLLSDCSLTEGCSHDIAAIKNIRKNKKVLESETESDAEVEEVR